MAVTEDIKKLTDDEIRELDNEYCSWGDTAHYSEEPKIFSSCDGSYMYDSNDTPYLDLQMWYASCNLGYKNKRVSEAVVDQINTMPGIAPKFIYNYKALLSEKIAKGMMKRFGEKGRVHFNVGGAQAIEDAIKVLRNYTHKNRQFAFMGGYHGRTIGASCITSSYRYRESYGHFGDRAHFVPFPYCFRCHYGKKCESCNFYCVKQFARNFESEYNSFYDKKTGDCEFGAFVCEPLLGTGGYVVPPKGYFKELKKVLDEFNIVFAVDEIQMGLYRTGKLWAIEHFGVTPDIMTFGKSLTNGLNPLAGFWAKEKLIAPDVFPPGRAHSTYSSNPLGTRAGYEVMSIMEEEDFETSVARKGKLFLEGLKSLKSKYSVIGDVDGLGLALRMEITQTDGITPNRELCDKLQEEGLKGDLIYKGKKCGLVLNNGGYYKNVITFVPSLYITDDEINMAIELLDQLFTRLEK